MTTDKEKTQDVCTPKFSPRTKVWLMRYNEPLQAIVYVAQVMPEWGAMGKDVWTYKVWPSDSLYGVKENDCVLKNEKDLFPTREELIASL